MFNVSFLIFNLIDCRFAALHLQRVIRLRREHKVGHRHLALRIKHLDAATVNKDA